MVKCSHRSKTGSRDAQTGRGILQLDSIFHWRIIFVLIATLPLLHSAIQPFIIKVSALLLGGPQFQKPLTAIQALTCSGARLKRMRSILFFSDSVNLSSVMGE